MQKCSFLVLVCGLIMGGRTGNAQTVASRTPYTFFWNPGPESSQPLPVEPIPASDEAFSFSAAQNGNGNLLTWDVPQPESVLNVIIEGSEDGSHFTDLESIAEAEAGVLDVFYDASPAGRRFYRLVANYPDGRQRATPVAQIANSTAFEVRLPSGTNPFTEVWSTGRIEIYDLQGTLLTAGDPVVGHYAFDLQSLPADSHCLIRSGSHRQLIQVQSIK